MASGTAAPSLFLRNATGLVKGWSGFDAFTYSFMSVNLVTLGMFYSLAVFAYVPTASTRAVDPLAAIAVTFLAIAYAGLIAVMPRAGGDYVWQTPRPRRDPRHRDRGRCRRRRRCTSSRQAVGLDATARARRRRRRPRRRRRHRLACGAASGSSWPPRAGGSSSRCGRRSTARSSRSSSSSRSPRCSDRRRRRLLRIRQRHAGRLDHRDHP